MTKKPSLKVLLILYKEGDMSFLKKSNSDGLGWEE